MSKLKHTGDHEWIRMEGDDMGVVGITDFAQQQLGDLVHIELPEVGTELAQSGEAAVIESVKAASDLHCPVSGILVAINESLLENPSLVNEDPTGEGWFLKIKLSDPSEVEGLMDEAAYQASLD